MPMMAFRRLGWFRALVAAEVLVAVCSVGGLVLLRQQVLDDELKSLSSLAQAMALQADRTLGLAATVLGDTRDELARGLLVPGTPQANELLRDRIKPLDNFRALSVFDAQGQRAATSRTEGTAMPPGVQQLDFFTQAQASSAPTLFVSAPFAASADGQLTVSVSTAWRDAQGRFLGVTALAAPPDFLEGGFARIRPTADARLRIHRLDGALLRPDDSGHTTDVVDAPVLRALWADASSGPAAAGSALAQTMTVQGHPRLVAMARLEHAPMLMLVSRDSGTVLAGWADLAWLISAFLASMLGVTFALGLKLARDQLHHEALAQRLARSRKLESLGKLAGGVAHDFNNVLAAVLGYGEMARDAAPEGSRQAAHLDQLIQAGLRGRQQVERILAFSRGQARRQQAFALTPLVHEVLDHLGAHLPANVQVERELGDAPLVVLGDPTALYEAVTNLCTNALQAMPQGGRLRVQLAAQHTPAPQLLYDSTLPPGQHARLTVSDSGSGMSAEVLARLFEPFFTTKGTQGGTGLGLAVVHGVVADLQGAIDVHSTPGEGTTFTLYLPLSTLPVAEPEAPSPEPPMGQGQTVLVVDDDAALVALAEELLAGLGYEPLGTSDPEAALAAVQADPQRFDLLLTDELMPGLCGTALTQAVRALRPDLPVVLASGYGGAQLDQRARDAGIRVLLAKPLTRQELAWGLHRALSTPATAT